MKQKFFNLEIQTDGQKLYNFTDKTETWVKDNKFSNGIINLSIQHTSASLIIQENADPDVQTDLIKYFEVESTNRLVNPVCKLSDKSFSIFFVISCQ